MCTTFLLYKQHKYLLLILLMITVTISCKKFVEIDPPRTDLIRKVIFESDNTANAAVLHMYYQMSTNTAGFGSGGLRSVSFLSGLSSDDALNRLTSFTDYQAFYTNSLVPSNSVVLNLWTELYNTIYQANAIIEGLSSSPKVSPAYKNQLTGEALLMRAFCHFYLLNLFGDCPLVLSTDYKNNQTIPRSSAANVYQQIKSDLMEARNLLVNDYSFSNNEKTRPSKMAATALLSRVCLYMKDWENAELYATEIINSNMFNLGAPSSTFLKNSSEAIWQLHPSLGNAYDAELANTYMRLLPNLLTAFEPNDIRYTNWVSVDKSIKYKSRNASYTEYSVLLRLAELYLIRAEARTQRNNFPGAIADIDIIRTRAMLPGTAANDKTGLLLAIEQERRVELFMEWGHRWLDLKRWDLATTKIGPLKSDWQATDMLYPIPDAQILNDPAMTQNPGY